MKNILPVALVLAAASTAFSQAAKISDADVKKLADALGAYIGADESDYKKREATQKAFAAEFERVEKALKPASLLSTPEAWTDVYAAKRTFGPAPSGLGRVAEKKVTESISGKTATFTYGLLLPNGYDPKKRYGLILALHDKSSSKDREATGAKYLEEVWMKVPKEERDAYIIVAPTLGTGALGKDFRVEWGDRLHFRLVAQPLRDMLTGYAVDFDRVFVEGTGEGGEFALHLALTRPHLFAAAAVRSTVPRFPQVLVNGGSLPVAAHFRAGSPAASSPVKGVMDQRKTTLALPLEMKEHPAGGAVKSSFASDVLPEASSEILTFFKDKKRNLAPKKLAFAVRSEAACYWIRLGKFVNDDNYGTTIQASVDTATNTIAVETTGIETFRILLNDRVLNLDQPVKVTVNGKPHTERQFTRSIDTLLKYFDENKIDPSLQPTAIIDVKVPLADGDATPAPPK